MKRFFLALIIGLAIASYADEHAKAAQVCKSGGTFGAKRVRLITGFNPNQLPNPTHGNPTPPYGNVGAPYIGLLEQAFCIASSDVQSALNKLDYVFVTDDANWLQPVGVWSSDNKMKYIIIPSSTLKDILQTSSLAGEENGLYRKLFNVTSFSYFSDNGATSPEAAALAVIAHELGHVLLAATNADGKYYHDNPNQHPNAPDRPGPNPDPCYDDTAFLKNGAVWDPQRAHANGQRRWVKFGDSSR
jgi:hypothetical protein